jgi:hypothetical protein
MTVYSCRRISINSSGVEIHDWDIPCGTSLYLSEDTSGRRLLEGFPVLRVGALESLLLIWSVHYFHRTLRATSDPFIVCLWSIRHRSSVLVGVTRPRRVRCRSPSRLHPRLPSTLGPICRCVSRPTCLRPMRITSYIFLREIQHPLIVEALRPSAAHHRNILPSSKPINITLCLSFH